MKRLFTGLLWVLILLAGLLILFLLWSTIADYKPEEETLLRNEDVSAYHISDTLSILSWNIGYGGLDAGMDFFYDGGTQVRPAEAVFKENIAAISSFLASRDDDFLLLQEVDRKARRSFCLDETELITGLDKSRIADYAKNYDVFFVPSPLNNPMGRVESGLLSLSYLIPGKSLRLAFPGNYSWPLRIFMLDRCMLLQRFPIEGGSDLVVINTHNSAFDDDGRLRKLQIAYLRDIILREYSLGNYVVCGGDWNQNPPGFTAENMHWEDAARVVPPTIDPDFLPRGWTWAWPDNAPTNRDVITAYQVGKTPCSIIDFFVVSPNIKVLDINTINLDFKNSDHNPVSLKILLQRN